MIRVLFSGLLEAGAEGILRSVTSDLVGNTAASRELELQAGEKVVDRLQAMGELPVGGAAITPGGGLPVSFLIHAVIQSREEPVRAEGVRAALMNGLRRAREWGLESLALPPLGCGAGNLDAEGSAAAMIPVIGDHLEGGEPPQEVIIVVASEYEEEVFLRAVAAAGRRAAAREN